MTNLDTDGDNKEGKGKKVWALTRLAELGFSHVDGEKLFAAIDVHAGRTPLMTEHLHPYALGMCREFDESVKERIGLNSVSFSVGCSMVNWMIITALNPEAAQGVLTDVDVLTFVDASSDSIKDHEEVVRLITAEIGDRRQLKFCKMNDPLGSFVVVNPFDFDMFHDPFLLADFHGAFLEEYYLTLREITRFDQLFGASHPGPAFRDLRERFKQGVISQASVMAQADPLIRERIVAEFEFPADASLTDALEILANLKLKVVSPIKTKHIIRAYTSLMRPGETVTIPWIKQVLGVLSSCGAFVDNP